MMLSSSESQIIIREYQQNIFMKEQAKKLEQEVLKEQINQLKSLAFHKKHLQKVKQYQNVSHQINIIQNQYQKYLYGVELEQKQDLQYFQKLSVQKENLEQKLYSQQICLNDQLFKKSLNLNFIDAMQQRHQELRIENQQIKQKQRLNKNIQNSLICSMNQQKKNNENIIKKNEKVLKQLRFIQFQIEQQKQLILNNLKVKRQEKQKNFQIILQKNIKESHQKMKELINQQRDLIQNKLSSELVTQQNLIQRMNCLTKTLEDLSKKKEHIWNVLQQQRFKENILQKKVANKSLQIQSLQQILYSKRLKSQIIMLGEGKQVYINQFELRQQIQTLRIQKQQKKQALNLMDHKIQLLKQARLQFSNMIRSYRKQDQYILNTVFSNSKTHFKMKNLQNQHSKTFQKEKHAQILKQRKAKAEMENIIQQNYKRFNISGQIIIQDRENICMKTGSTAFSYQNKRDQCNLSEKPNQQLIELRKRLEQRFTKSNKCKPHQLQ